MTCADACCGICWAWLFVRKLHGANSGPSIKNNIVLSPKLLYNQFRPKSNTIIYTRLPNSLGKSKHELLSARKLYEFVKF